MTLSSDLGHVTDVQSYETVINMVLKKESPTINARNSVTFTFLHFKSFSFCLNVYDINENLKRVNVDYLVLYAKSSFRSLNAVFIFDQRSIQ